MFKIGDIVEFTQSFQDEVEDPNVRVMAKTETFKIIGVDIHLHEARYKLKRPNGKMLIDRCSNYLCFESDLQQVNGFIKQTEIHFSTR